MASLKYSANSSLQTVTLGSAYTAGDGSMTLTSGHGARLPSFGDFWLSYNNGAGTIRLFKVTARSTDTLTVTADATEGSGDGNISSGETLRWALTAAALDQLRTDICGYGTYANLPATCKAGDQYRTSDSPYEFVATATNTWTAFHNGQRVVIPSTSGWTDVNTPTVSTTYGAQALTKALTSTTTLSLRYRTAPGTPYVIKAKILHNMGGWLQGNGNGQSSAWLVGFRDSAGKYVNFRVGTASSAVVEFATDKWSDSTTYNSVYKGFSAYTSNSSLLNPLWVAWGDNGTNIKFWLSLDGVNWVEWDSRARGDYLSTAPNAVTWGVYANASDAAVTLLSWEELAQSTP